MKTKQRVKLIFTSPLWLISNGIRFSHDNHNQSDTIYFSEENKTVYSSCIKIGKKDFNLIKKIGFVHFHQSVLEHSLIVFDVHMTTKSLLEESRSRIGVSQTVTSSRYALDLIDIEREPTGDSKLDEFNEKYRLELIELIDSYRNDKGRIFKKDMDRLSLSLPQWFIYKMQLSFNLRSLVGFLKLRLGSEVHINIRQIAYMLFKELPDDYKELVLADKDIAKKVNQCKRDFDD